MVAKSSVFDMIGPVMIGPSSSHTAGVVRIAQVAASFFNEQPDEARITFYNSFARTYEGHGSDRAVIAGLLRFNTDDKRIKKALEWAKKSGLSYSFRSVANASTYHPNSVRIALKKASRTVEVLGESLGGGVINIAEVDGFNANFSGAYHTLIIYADDVEGSIALIASVLANEPCNIATMSVSRKAKKDTACLVIEVDSEVKILTRRYLQALHWVDRTVYIPAIYT